MSESRLIQYLIAVPDGKASKKGKLLKAHAGQGIIKSWDIDGATIHGWIDGTVSAEPHVRQVEALEQIADTLRLIYLMQRKQLAVLLGGAAKGPIDETVLDDLDVDKEK